MRKCDLHCIHMHDVKTHANSRITLARAQVQ